MRIVYVRMFAPTSITRGYMLGIKKRTAICSNYPGRSSDGYSSLGRDTPI